MSRQRRPSSEGDSSSEQLHIYEDIDAPPRLPPASGVLHFHQGKVIIKPVAFKPVVGSSVLSPSTPPGHRRLLSSIHTSPYSSADSATPGHYSSSYPLDDRSSSSSSAPVSQPRRSYSYPSEYGDTPSPPSGGYADLLREKDAEINYLRETLEHNEQVIFKVYAEKEQGWRRELAKSRAQLEAKLRALQQQLAKSENLHGIQSYQMSQENRKLKLDLEEQQKSKASKEIQIDNLQKQLSTLETQLEETEWSLCEKVGEISLLKSQLKDCQNDNTHKTTEMLSLKVQLRESRALLQEKNATIEDLKEKLHQSQQELAFSKQHLERVIQGLQAQCEDSAADLEDKTKVILQQKKDLDLLKSELHSIHQELKKCKEQFEEERCKWLIEKDKVIQYQKHLQLNYVHMYHRNRSLKNEVESLSLELNKDGKSHCGESHC